MRTANLSIVIPAATSQSSPASATRRRPAYVSPSTETILVTAIYPGTSPAPGEPVDVAPGSPNCTAAMDGSRTCNVSVAVLTGATSLDVAALDANKARLSHAVVDITGITGLVIDITVTLGGDAATTVLSIGGGEFTSGLIGTRTIVVDALDADGNTIVLPGAFDVPIRLSASDASVTVSPQFLVNPGDVATVTYDGNPTSNTVVTATVNGAVSRTGVVRVVGTGPPPTPVAPPSVLPVSSPTPQPVVTLTPVPGGSPTPGTGTGIIIINGHRR